MGGSIPQHPPSPKGNAGAFFAMYIPEPSTANIAQIPFWVENIDPEQVTFGRRPPVAQNPPTKKLTGQNYEILG